MLCGGSQVFNVSSWQSRKVLFVGLYIVAYLALAYCYTEIIYPAYWHYRFELGVNLSRVAVGLMLIIGPALLLPTQTVKPSDIFLHLLFLFPLLPMIVIYAVGAGDFNLVLWSYFGLVFVFFFNRVPVNYKQLAIFNVETVAVFAAVLTVIIILLLAYYLGFNSLSFDVTNLYLQRAKIDESLPLFFGYLTFLVTKVLLPLLLAFALLTNKNRILTIGFSLIAALLMFGYTYHRTPLAVPFAIAAIYFITQSRYGLAVLLSGFTMLVLFALATDQVTIGAIVREVIYRLYFVPALTNFAYYDFFQSNPFVFFSDSKLSLGQLKYPYSQSVPFLIGPYVGHIGSHVNTGWLGSGYMQAGGVGILFYGALIGMLFRLIDKIAQNLNNLQLVVCTTFLPIFWIFMSSDLPSVLLTHGLGVALLLLLATRKFSASEDSSSRHDHQVSMKV